MGRRAKTKSFDTYATTIVNPLMTERDEVQLFSIARQEVGFLRDFTTHTARASILQQLQEVIKGWHIWYEELLGKNNWVPAKSFSHLSLFKKLDLALFSAVDPLQMNEFQDRLCTYFAIFNAKDNSLVALNTFISPVLQTLNQLANTELVGMTDLPETINDRSMLFGQLLDREITIRVNLLRMIYLVEKYIIKLNHTSLVALDVPIIHDHLKMQLKLVAEWMLDIKSMMELYYTVAENNELFIEQGRLPAPRPSCSSIRVESEDDPDDDYVLDTQAQVSSNISKPVPSDPIPPHVSSLSKRSLHDPELTKQFILELYPESHASHAPQLEETKPENAPNPIDCDASHAPQLAETKPENTPNPIDWSKFKSSRKAYEREFLAGNLGNEPIGEMGVLAGAKGVLLDYVNGTLGMSRFFHPKRHHGAEVRKILAIKTLPELIDALKAVDKKAEGSLARRIAFIEEKIRTYVSAFTPVEASKPFDFDKLCVSWKTSF